MKKFVLFVLCSLCLSFLIMLPFAGGLAGFFDFFASAHALFVIVLCGAGFAVCSFVFGVFTGDYSWVDRLWSTLPVAFVWFYVWRGGFSPALCVSAAITTIWGARLTFNFARKGGYSGVEDYRWNILKKRIANPFLWQMFNLSFISFFQIGLFVLFTYPVYSMTLFAPEKIPALFWPFTILALAFICVETTADQQQWKFHAAKKAAAAGETYPEKYTGDVKQGFLSGGLFAFSRHPNYFGELGTWWSVWLMALSLCGGIARTGCFGPLALTALFIGSTIFTESLTAPKYPDYKNYQSRVSPIIPWFPKRLSK